MKIVKDHVPYSQKRRPNIKINPTSITIHGTANTQSSAKGERNWLTNPQNTRTASWHYCIDDTGIAIEAIPYNEMAYHAGGNGTGNRTSISIEICESGNRQKTLDYAVELVQYLMKKHGIKTIYKHNDWSGKICPRILYNGSSWKPFEDFKKRCLSVSSSTAKTSAKPLEKPSAASGIKTGAKVTLKTSASTYATGQTIPTAIKGKKYTVMQTKGNEILLKEIMSWVYSKDVSSGSAKKPAANKKIGTVKVTAPELYYYDKADWSAKAGIVKKGEAFTVVKIHTVSGSKMYELISGTFLTANKKYVHFSK